jgi:transcriptional regulator with XRE-family HTH domain
MRYWWDQFGNFAPDPPGDYPVPGQVVARYREMSGLSRVAASTALHVSENMFYYIEQRGISLNLLSRLRQLQRLLSIPPELLGLCNPPKDGLWWSAYGSFPMVSEEESPDYGFPHPGSVVKYYRQLKEWTQVDMAEATDLSEMAIRRMEKNSAYFDTLSRRRALHFLLGIPPVLLGLDTAHLLTPPSPQTVITVSGPLLAEVQAVQSALWSGYYAGHARDRVQSVQTALGQIKSALPSVSSVERPAWLEQQSLLYQGLANITREYADDNIVLSYSNQGVKLARLVDDPNLLAVALVRRAETLADRGYYELAEKSEQEALGLTVTDPVVASGRFISSPRVFAVSASDQDDRSQIFSLLDRARPFPMDQYGFNLDQTCLDLRAGQALVNLAQNAPDRSRLLRQAESRFAQIDLATTGPRRVLLVKLGQAQIALGLREYERAAALAIEAFPLLKQIQSVLYLPQFVEIYWMLQRSSFASSPQVAHLGLLLFESGAL